MRYVPDHAGMGRLLVSHDMAQAMQTVADAGAGHAESIAPVETGEYAAEFGVAAIVDGDRAAGILFNNSDHAALVEWGFERQAGHHVLAQTADWIEAGG